MKSRKRRIVAMVEVVEGGTGTYEHTVRELV